MCKLQTDLFGLSPAFLPGMREGETLYSWGAQYHRLSGNVLAKESSLQLFDDGRAGLRHDFPSHLDRLVEKTGGLLGDAEAIACGRTMFGFFAPFQTREGACSVLSQMRGTSVAKVKSDLGLLPSRIGGFFPLKACPDCIKKDLSVDGLTKWHVEHQWPSTWVCRIHQRPLRAVKRGYQPRDLRRWLLPEDVPDAEWDTYAIDESSRRTMQKVAEASLHIVESKGRHLNDQLLRYVYLLGAKEREWLAPDGSLKLAQVKRLFLSYYRGLDSLPGFAVLKTAEAEHGGILGLLMRQYGWHRHPVKHVLLMTFLFDSMQRFDATYDAVRMASNKAGAEGLRELMEDGWSDRLRHLVEIEHESVSHAASMIGIPLAVAHRAARRHRIQYQKRPRVDGSELGERIMRMLAEGISREEILHQTGVKKTLLRAIMERHPDVRDVWRRLDSEHLRDHYRENFMKLVSEYQGVPVKKLRHVPGNGISWLYRNDREWYWAHLPTMTPLGIRGADT